jgi:hypothetical protein
MRSCGAGRQVAQLGGGKFVLRVLFLQKFISSIYGLMMLILSFLSPILHKKPFYIPLLEGCSSSKAQF